MAEEFPTDLTKNSTPQIYQNYWITSNSAGRNKELLSSNQLGRSPGNKEGPAPILWHSIGPRDLSITQKG